MSLPTPLQVAKDRCTVEELDCYRRCLEHVKRQILNKQIKNVVEIINTPCKVEFNIDDFKITTNVAYALGLRLSCDGWSTIIKRLSSVTSVVISPVRQFTVEGTP